MRSGAATAIGILGLLGLAALAVAVALATANSYSIMPTRSGSCELQAGTACPPLPTGPIRVFEPNWFGGIGIALIVGFVATVLLVQLRARSSAPK